MATITTAWKVLWMLGSLIWGSSLAMAFKVRLLDVDFGNAPPAFKNIMYALSCVVLLVMIGKGIISIMQGYQKYRTDKLKNDFFKHNNNINNHKK